MTYSFSEKYPEIFSRVGDCIECGAGWYPLIDKMCQVIMETCAEKGWRPPVAEQVKEKFATLRFYVDRAEEEIYDIIDRACDLSAHICEECGEPGRPRTDRSWMQTLCDTHAD